MVDLFLGAKEEICRALEGTAGSTAEEIRKAIVRARAARKHWFPNALTPAKVESALKKLQKQNWVTMKGIRQTSLFEVLHSEPVYVLSYPGQRRARPAGPELDDLGRPLTHSYD